LIILLKSYIIKVLNINFSYMPTGIYKHKSQTEETKSKIGNKNRGRKHSEETKRKISEIRKKEWADGLRNQNKEKNPNWKGGRRKRGQYIMILQHEHPNADKKGYVFEHRLVMEKKLGRYLKNDEFVHHRNAVKLDNRPANLELVIKKIHCGYVKCPYCNKKFLIR